jgi:hypothetical protein
MQYVTSSYSGDCSYRTRQRRQLPHTPKLRRRQAINHTKRGLEHKRDTGTFVELLPSRNSRMAA